MPNWIYPNFEFEPEQPHFLCISSNADNGKILGISATGTSPELMDYTPRADAELVVTNKIISPNNFPTKL